MKVEFDIKITASDLYDYMLYHTYSGFSGLFGSIVGALFIVYFALSGTWYYLAAGGIILLYIPCSLFLRAKKQAATNEFFKKPLHYVLNLPLEKVVVLRRGCEPRVARRYQTFEDPVYMELQDNNRTR